MKFVVVTGGVVSGLGKGITISSIGRILKSSGMRVTSIKIDPYLNVDAGLMSPFEHGETFVLDDGGETDLDLGNYERFLDITLTAKHNLTSGKAYNEVIAFYSNKMNHINTKRICIYVGHSKGAKRVCDVIILFDCSILILCLLIVV